LYTDDIRCLSPYKTCAPLSPTASTDNTSTGATVDVLVNPLHQKWDIGSDGGIVVLRPDGHVGTLSRSLNSDGWMVVERYFQNFLVL
jgi:hypothetical protein